MLIKNNTTMKKLLMAMFFSAGAFTVSAQVSEAPVQEKPGEVRKETVVANDKAELTSEAQAEAKFREMREAVKTLEAQKSAIRNDKSLTEAQRRDRLQKLQDEHDELNRRIKN